MKRWVRAQLETQCGSTEGCRIAVGQPVQEIRGQWTHPKYRCTQHADGPVNWDEIAEFDAQRAKATAERPVTSQPTTYRGAEPALFDGKAKAAGED